MLLLATSCNKAELADLEIEKPNISKGQTSVTIIGDNVVSTRASNGRVEFTGGYATGAGLYDGDASATVQAVPYSGYQLKSFTGGQVGGNLSQYSGSNQYTFPIQKSDWKFSVMFKKEFQISVSAGTGGTVKGGGTVLEDESCTVTAYPSSGYKFDGWYEGNTKVNSSESYTFVVSSNRTIHIFI